MGWYGIAFTFRGILDGYSVPATGVRNSSHLGASFKFMMPFTFSFEEYADMIYVYGFCDGNSVLVVAEYQQRFPNRRIQTGECLLEFTRHCEIPVDFPAFVLQPSMVLMKASMKKALFVWYSAVHDEYAKNCKMSSCSPHKSVENTACRGHVSIPRAASATSPTWRFY